MKTKPADTPYCGVRKSYIQNMAQPVIDDTTLLYLYQFIQRRYKIHIRKDIAKKDPPWTKDRILQQYRFTNIRREHDKESKWVIKHITSNPELSYEDKLLNVILFRLYNKHETAELISMPFKFSETPDWNPEWYRSLFEVAMVEDPKRVFFTAAFHTVGMKNALKNVTGESYAPMRILKFIKILINDGLVDDIKACTNQQEVYQTLTDYNGIGRFLAYQFYVDMTYIAEFPFSENEFTVAGPGCRHGLDMLFLRKDGMTYEECLFWLRDNLDDLFINRLKKPWNPQELFSDLPEEDRYMNVMSLENCFCELFKYIKAKTGTGRPRKKYIPRRNKYEKS